MSALLAPPATAADALRHYAALEALKDLVKEQQDELRAFLQARADEHAQREGTSYNNPLKGVGRVYVTEPARKVIVTDDQAWGAWVAANFPARCSVRTRANEARLLVLCREDPQLEERLRKAHIIEDESVIDDSFLDEIRAGTVLRVQETDSFGFVDRETGERLPLASTQTTRPTLTIKIEKTARERFIAELRDHGAPQLPSL